MTQYQSPLFRQVLADMLRKDPASQQGANQSSIPSLPSINPQAFMGSSGGASSGGLGGGANLGAGSFDTSLSTPYLDSFGSSGAASGGASGAGGGMSSLAGAATPALFAALIGAGKNVESNNPDSWYGRGLLSMLGPSGNQIKQDRKLGWTTALGIPFVNGFIRNDDAAKADPEWKGVFG